MNRELGNAEVMRFLDGHGKKFSDDGILQTVEQDPDNFTVFCQYIILTPSPLSLFTKNSFKRLFLQVHSQQGDV